MFPFMAWTPLWKHVNNPESVGASQYRCDQPTNQTSMEIGLILFCAQGDVTGTVESTDSWINEAVNLMDADT